MHRIEETLERGICIGCGACSVITGGVVPIRLSSSGIYSADISTTPDELIREASEVCPFSDEASSEDELGAPSLDLNCANWDPRVGAHSASFVARVNDDDYVLKSSSGGLASWLIGELSRNNLIDAFISVANSTRSEELFAYSVKGASDYALARKSAYYAATLEEALAIVKESDRRYALIGVPCFIKAARLLGEKDPVLKQRIRFFVGLVCGHMKSQNFGPSLAWQLGVSPQNLKAIDFRIKRPGRPSSSYDFGAVAIDGSTVNAPTRDLVGANWGHGAFQPEACNFCDDVFAETADVALGDAWLPQYTQDWRGRNIVVSRNVEIDSVIRKGIESGALDGEEVDIEVPVHSQLGNFRHRREGLSVRLADDRAAGLSIPRKRVQPDQRAVGHRRRRLIRQRRRMSRISITAFNEALAGDDLAIYLDQMKKEIRRYRRIENYSINHWRKLVGKGLRVLQKKLGGQKPQ